MYCIFPAIVSSPSLRCGLVSFHATSLIPLHGDMPSYCLWSTFPLLFPALRYLNLIRLFILPNHLGFFPASFAFLCFCILDLENSYTCFMIHFSFHFLLKYSPSSSGRGSCSYFSFLMAYIRSFCLVLPDGLM